MPQANNLKIWEQFLWRFCREFFIDWFCNCSKFLGFLLWNFLRDSTGNLIKTFSSNSIYWEIRPTKKKYSGYFSRIFFFQEFRWLCLLGMHRQFLLKFFLKLLEKFRWWFLQEFLWQFFGIFCGNLLVNFLWKPFDVIFHEFSHEKNPL